MSPLQAHVAHLRHLAKTRTASLILRSRFGFSATAAKETAPLLSSFVEQGVAFHEESIGVRVRVRPVLQYYAFLNLAVAAILAYRPQRHAEYKHHGIKDLTGVLGSLELGSRVVSVGKGAGAVPLFHSILSDDSISGRTFRMKDLLGANPMVQLELSTAFHIDFFRIGVQERLVESNRRKDSYESELRFELRFAGAKPVNEVRFPRARIEKAIPMLKSDYRCVLSGRQVVTYRSKNVRPKSREEDAMSWHRDRCRRAINFFSASPSPWRADDYMWTTIPRIPILPTLSASLMFSFALASIMRYRPNLVAALEDSHFNLASDTYVAEIDSIFIPALRNLLYCEELFIGPTEGA